MGIADESTYDSLKAGNRSLSQPENALEKALEEFGQIFEMSLDMICIADIHTAKFIKINSAFTETLGFEKEFFLGRPFFDFIHPEDIGPTRFIVESKLQKGEKVINFENRYRCKDGSYKWLSWVSHPNPDKGVTYSIARDITQAKLTDQKLKENEERYRRLAENSPDIIYRMSLPDGTYEYVSPAAKNIFGYPPEAWYENRLLIKEIIHPAWHPYFKEQWEQLLKGKVPPTYEYQVVHKNGEVRWINQRNVAVRDTGGNLVAIEGIVTDLTDRKKAEEALIKKDAMLRNIASQVPGMLFQFMMAPDGRYSVPYSSEGVKDIFGCSPDDIRDDFSPIFNAIYYEDRDKILQTIEASVKSMSQWICEYRVHIPGKPIKWVYGNSIPEKRADGSIVWSGFNMDITERKLAETALRESEEQFRHFFEHLTIGVAVYEAVDDGEDFIFSDINPVGQKLSSVSLEDIRGKRLTQIFPGVRDLGLLRALQDTWRTGQPHHVPFSKYEDERIIEWVENRIFRLPSGKVVAVYDDRTELMRLEEGLRQAQKMEAIGTLAGGIAHDFNNILFPIIGYTEMIMEDVSENSKAHKYLKEILSGAMRAKELVQQILTFSRKGNQELKPLNVQSVVKEALKLISSTLPATIEIRQNIDNDCGKVIADPTQVHQIIMNLCTNAYHAMEESGGVLEVSLREIEIESGDFLDMNISAGPYLLLTVSDTGCGIDKALLDRIFDPYFSTKEREKGTGLGLSVVHGIIKRYGGNIKVYSEVGKGTVFKVYLPVIRTGFEESKAVAGTVNIPKGSERILLVDDEEPIAQMAKQVLERLGYQVTTQTSSIEALETFRTTPNQFDLVITDMTMPNMTGDQLAQKIIEIRPDMPAILCTGFSERMNPEKAKSIGISSLIMKPIVKSELAKTIREVLDGNE